MAATELPAKKRAVLLVIEGLLIVGLAYAAARVVWAFTAPVGPFGSFPVIEKDVAPVPEYAGLDALFGFQSLGGDTVVSAAGIELFGLRLDQASGRGSAILAPPDGPQRSYRIDEEVMPGIALADVRHDHIILMNGGRREAIYIDQSAPADPVGAVASTGVGE